MSEKNIDNETILNIALKLTMEFGENWMQPIQNRLSKRFTNLSNQELDNYNDICQKILED